MDRKRDDSWLLMMHLAHKEIHGRLGHAIGNVGDLTLALVADAS